MREREESEGRQTSITCLPHMTAGTEPVTQACVLTGNRTGDPLVHGPALNPLRHSSQAFFKKYVFICFCFILLDLSTQLQSFQGQLFQLLNYIPLYAHKSHLFEKLKNTPCNSFRTLQCEMFQRLKL